MNWKFLIPLAIGAVLVIFNKQFGAGQKAWNETIFPRFTSGATPWLYRIGYILVGVIFLLIGATGLWNGSDPQ